MKKVRNLRFLGIVGVIIAVLFLVSISVTQSQVSIQGKPDQTGKKPKPDDPPATATWAVQLSVASDSMFYGMGSGRYEDNGANIEVSVEKNSMSGPWKKYFNFTYAFDFILTNDNLGTGNPPTDQVGFQNVSELILYDVGYPNPGPVSIFPFGVGILSFLNNLHPYSDGIPENAYESIWLEIHIFDHDIELMETGPENTYVFGSDRVASDPGDYFSIWARYRSGCSPEIYHDVELYRSINVERAVIKGNTPNIEIERMNDNTWRFWIKSYDGDGYLKVKEQYCTIVKRKARTVYSMEAKANFDFYIDFIKISN